MLGIKRSPLEMDPSVLAVGRIEMVNLSSQAPLMVQLSSGWFLTGRPRMIRA